MTPRRHLKLVFATAWTLALAGFAASSHAVEFWCEGLDDEGNGEIDEGCSRVCPDPFASDAPVTVAPSSVGATGVALVRAGTGFGWAYADARLGASQVYVQITATSGAADKPEVRITDGVHVGTAPAIAWRGNDGFAVAWVDERDGNAEIYFRLLDANGVPLPASVPLNVSSNTGTSLNPTLLWIGTEFLVAWDDTKGSNRDIYFRRIDGAGQTIGQPVRVISNSALQEQASVAWDGTQYAIAWTDERDGNREIYARRFDASGNPQAGEVRITTAAGISERPSIRAYGVGGFGIAWQDARSGANAVWYGRWTGPGYASPPGVGITTSGPARKPSLTTTGAEDIVVWVDSRNGPDDVYARRIALDGTPSSAEIRLTVGAASTAAVAAWHGSGAGVAFLGNDTGASRPRIVLLGCGGPDADADGATLSQGECNDASTIQRPGLGEACDALDNNCDGAWDENCRGTCRANLPSASEDVYIGEFASARPQVAWDGQGYGVAWQEQELYPGCCLAWAVFFRRIDANGAPVSPAVRLPIASLAGEQISLAWNGSEYGVVWEQYDRVDFVARIAFQRIDATGTPIGTPKEVTRDPAVGSVGHRVPVLIWRHDQYGLLFLDVRPDGLPRANMFLRLDREGRPLERPRDVSPAPYSEYGYLTADPYGFALAYLYLIDPYFQRLDRFGGLRGAAFQLKNDDFDQGFPQVVATPWGYAFTWTEDSGFPNVVGRIHYQRFDLNGNPQGPAVNLMPTLPGGSANGFPSQLVWLGSEFLFAYHESQGRIRLDRVDPTGGRMGPDVLVVSDTPSTIAYPFLAWNGSRPLVAWSDSRVGGVGHPRSVTSFLTCCEEVAPPVAVSGAGWSDAATFVWSASGAERYDRVRGDLMTLRSLGGDYTPTVLECSNDLLTTSSAETGQPGSLSGWYYLVRGDGVCGEGSYDDPVVQPFTSRDAGINSSASSCP